MNITFTGIQNLSIKKKEYDKWGSYLNTDGHLASGEKNYTEVILSCNLTDDKDGKHLSQYLDIFSKVPNNIKGQSWNGKISPATLKIHAVHQKAKDTEDCIPSTHFTLNNVDIGLTHRELLPLYTYMARLTRQIAAMPDATAAQKNYANFINQAVHEEACRFIDLM